MKIPIGGKKEQKARSLAAAPTTAVPDEGGLQRALEEEPAATFLPLPSSDPRHIFLASFCRALVLRKQGWKEK